MLDSQVTFIFNNNTVDQNGQGQAIFADGVGLCMRDDIVNSTDQVSTSDSSIFSYASVFDFRQVSATIHCNLKGIWIHLNTLLGLGTIVNMAKL